MRKEAVKVTPGEIIPPGPETAPAAAKAKPRAKAATAASPSSAARAKAAKAAVSAAAAVATAAGVATDGDAGVSGGAAQAAPRQAERPGPSPRAAAAAAALPVAAPAPAAPAAPAPAAAPEPATTRRNFFRLDIFDVQVVFTVEQVGTEEATAAAVRGSLGDVSAGGLRLIADTGAGAMPDWPVGAGVTGRLQFALLEDEPGFDLPGRLVRRVETTTGYELAFSWDDPPQPEVDRLVHSLYQLEVRRRAATPDGKHGRSPQKSAQASAGARARSPLLLGAAIGVAASLAVYESVAGAAVAPVLGIVAVVCAAAYLVVGL